MMPLTGNAIQWFAIQGEGVFSGSLPSIPDHDVQLCFFYFLRGYINVYRAGSLRFARDQKGFGRVSGAVVYNLTCTESACLISGPQDWCEIIKIFCFFEVDACLN